MKRENPTSITTGARVNVRANSFAMSFIRRKYSELNPDGHWFDRSSMRFFNTRLPQIGYMAHDGTCLFVTSEQPPRHSDGSLSPRKFSVRALRTDGRMDTIGKFWSFDSRAEAMEALRSEMFTIKFNAEVAA
jgi:hypothetical protein